MITGIFSDVLERAAIWFLYIFVSPNATILGSKILNKRANQIKWLKRIDALNSYYNYGELVDIIERGIIKRYGKTPAQLLTTIYNSASAKIGALPSDELENLKVETKDLDSGKTETKNFWNSLDDIIEFIREIMSLFGLEKETSVKPSSYDWPKGGTGGEKEAAVGDILPWLLTGTIIYTLYKSGDKKPKKENS
jgi:hypothetical protein